MKNKGILSENSSPKTQKTTTFIVRPKHSQPKIMQPVLPFRLQNKLVDNVQTIQKSLQICLRALQQQIVDSVMMERSVSQKIEGLLLTLREKYIYQEQNCNQYEKDGRSQLNLRKNQGTKQIGRGKLSTEHLMNKENGSENASCFLAYGKGKSLRAINKNISGTIDEEHIDTRMVQLNRKLEMYQMEQLALKVQIVKLESDLNSQAVENMEREAILYDLKHEKSQIQRMLCTTMTEKETIQASLQRQRLELTNQLIASEEKLATTQKYLKQREAEALNLWQVLQKTN